MSVVAVFWGSGIAQAKQVVLDNTSLELTVRNQKEECIVDSWAPFYCVYFLLYFQTLKVVELGFVRLKLSEELVVTRSSRLAARMHLLPRCTQLCVTSSFVISRSRRSTQDNRLLLHIF